MRVLSLLLSLQIQIQTRKYYFIVQGIALVYILRNGDRSDIQTWIAYDKRKTGAIMRACAIDDVSKDIHIHSKKKI